VANVDADRLTLAPGAAHTMTMMTAVER
jgi:hypothetical protein